MVPVSVVPAEATIIIGCKPFSTSRLIVCRSASQSRRSSLSTGIFRMRLSAIPAKRAAFSTEW